MNIGKNKNKRHRTLSLIPHRKWHVIVIVSTIAKSLLVGHEYIDDTYYKVLAGQKKANGKAKIGVGADK